MTTKLIKALKLAMAYQNARKTPAFRRGDISVF